MLNVRHLLFVGVASTVCLSPTIAEAATTYSLSGSFSNTFNEGNLSTSSIVKDLAGGSFSGSYSIEGGLPSTEPEDFLFPSSFLVTLFKADSSTALTTFSSDSGDFGVISDDDNADFLNFVNEYGLLQLVFENGFNGTASTQSSIGLSPSGFAVFNADEFAGSIGVISGESKQVPTPALLPGLMGISASLWKRKRDEKEKVATV